jgi:hypothetical protein
VSYNASVVNFNSATGSLARFENKNILFYFEKRSSLLQRWRCSCKFKNRRIGSSFGRKLWTKLGKTWSNIVLVSLGVFRSGPINSSVNRSLPKQRFIESIREAHNVIKASAKFGCSVCLFFDLQAGTYADQGCQIFLGTAFQKRGKITSIYTNCP